MGSVIDSRRKVGPQVRKAAGKRLDEALDALRDPLEDEAVQDEAVHTTRKRVKEVRALLRLVRDDIDGKTFTRDNHALRDATRPLSELRDSAALVDAFDALRANAPSDLPAETLDIVRSMLTSRSDDVRRRVVTEGHALDGAARAMTEVRGDIDHWALQHRSWKALQRGLHRAYAQAKNAMTTALVEVADADLHTWRKRTKDLRYQLELLEPIWPPMMKALAAQARELGDVLGDDHDLAVLSTVLDSELAEVSVESLGALHELIARRRAQLQAAAGALGAKLFAEPATSFTERIKAYWNATATLETEARHPEARHPENLEAQRPTIEASASL